MLEWAHGRLLRPLQERLFKRFGYYDLSTDTFHVNAVHINDLLDRAAAAGADPGVEAVPSSAAGAGPSGDARLPHSRVRLVKAEVRSRGLVQSIRGLTGKSIAAESVHILCEVVPDAAPAPRPGTQAGDEGGRGSHTGNAHGSTPLAAPGAHADDDRVGSEVGSGASSDFLSALDDDETPPFASDDDVGLGGAAGEGDGWEALDVDAALLAAVGDAVASGDSTALSPTRRGVAVPSAEVPALARTPPPTPPHSHPSPAPAADHPARAARSHRRLLPGVRYWLKHVRRALTGTAVSVDTFHAALRIPPASPPPDGAAPVADTIVLHLRCVGGLHASVDDSGSETDRFEASVRLGEWQLYVTRVPSEAADTAASADTKERTPPLAQDPVMLSMPLEDLVLATRQTAPPACASTSTNTAATATVAACTSAAIPTSAAAARRGGTGEGDGSDVADEAEEKEEGDGRRFSHVISVRIESGQPLSSGGTPAEPPSSLTPPCRRVHVSARLATVSVLLTPTNIADLLASVNALCGTLPPPPSAAAPIPTTRTTTTSTASPALPTPSARSHRRTATPADAVAAAAQRVEAAAVATAVDVRRHARLFLELSLPTGSVTLVTASGCASAVRGAVGEAWRRVHETPPSVPHRPRRQGLGGFSGSLSDLRRVPVPADGGGVGGATPAAPPHVYEVLAAPHMTVAVTGVDALLPTLDLSQLFTDGSSSPAFDARVARKKRDHVRNLFRKGIADAAVTERLAQPGADGRTVFLGMQSLLVTELRSWPALACTAPTPVLHAEKVPYALVLLLRRVSDAPPSPLVRQEVVAVSLARLHVAVDGGLLEVGAQYAREVVSLLQHARGLASAPVTAANEEESSPAVPVSTASTTVKLLAADVGVHVRFAMPTCLRAGEGAQVPPQASYPGREGTETQGEEEEGEGAASAEVDHLRHHPQLHRLLRHLCAKSRRYGRDPASATRAVVGFAHESAPRFLAEQLRAFLKGLEVTCDASGATQITWSAAALSIEDPVAATASTAAVEKPYAARDLVRLDRGDGVAISVRLTDLLHTGRVCRGGASVESSGGASRKAADAPAGLRRVLTVTIAGDEVTTEPLTPDDYLLVMHFVRALRQDLRRARRRFAPVLEGPDTAGCAPVPAAGVESPPHAQATLVGAGGERGGGERRAAVHAGLSASPLTVPASLLVDMLGSDDSLTAALLSSMAAGGGRAGTSAGRSAGRRGGHNTAQATRRFSDGTSFEATPVPAAAAAAAAPVANAVWWCADASAFMLEFRVRRVRVVLLAPRLSPLGTPLGEPLFRCLSSSVAASTDLALLYHRYQLDISRFSLALLTCEEGRAGGPRRCVTHAGGSAAPHSPLPPTLDVRVRVTAVELVEVIPPSPPRELRGLVGRTVLVRGYVHGAAAPAAARAARTSSAAETSAGVASCASRGRGGGGAWMGKGGTDTAPATYSHDGDHPSGYVLADGGEGEVGADGYVCRVRVTCRDGLVVAAAAAGGGACGAAIVPEEVYTVDLELCRLGFHHLPAHMGDAWPAVIRSFFADRGHRDGGEPPLDPADPCAKPPTAGLDGVSTRPPENLPPPHQSQTEATAPRVLPYAFSLELSVTVADVLWAYGPQEAHAPLLVWLAPHLALHAVAPDAALDPLIRATAFMTRPASFYLCDDFPLRELATHTLNVTGRGWEADLLEAGFVRVMGISILAPAATEAGGCLAADEGTPRAAVGSAAAATLHVDRSPNADRPIRLRACGLHVSAFAAPDTLHVAAHVASTLAAMGDLAYVELPHALVMRSNARGAFAWVGGEVARSTALVSSRINEQLPCLFPEGGAGGRRGAALPSFPSVPSISGMTFAELARGTTTSTEAVEADGDAGELDQCRLWRRTHAPLSILTLRVYSRVMADLLREDWPPRDSAEADAASGARACRAITGEDPPRAAPVSDSLQSGTAAPIPTRPAVTTTTTAATPSREWPTVGTSRSSSFASVSDALAAPDAIVWRVLPLPPDAARPPTATPRPAAFDLSAAVRRDPHCFSGLLPRARRGAAVEPIAARRIPLYLTRPRAAHASAPSHRGRGERVGPAAAAAAGGRGGVDGRAGGRACGEAAAAAPRAPLPRRVLPPIAAEVFLSQCSVDVTLYSGHDLTDAATRRRRRGVRGVSRGRPPSPLHSTAPSSPLSGHSPPDVDFGEARGREQLVARLRGVSMQLDAFAPGAEEQRWLHIRVEEGSIDDGLARSEVRRLLAASPRRPGEWLPSQRFLEVSWLTLVPRHTPSLAVREAGRDGNGSDGGGPALCGPVVVGNPEEEVIIALQPVSIMWSGASLDFLQRLAAPTRRRDRPSPGEAGARGGDDDSGTDDGEDLWGEPVPARAHASPGPTEVEMFLSPPLFFRVFTLRPTVITLSGSFDSDAGLLHSLAHGSKVDVLRNVPLLSWVSVRQLPLTIPEVTVEDCGSPALLLHRLLTDTRCLSLRFLLTMCCCTVQPLPAAMRIAEAAGGLLLAPVARYRRSETLTHALAAASTMLAGELVAQSAHVGAMVANNTHRATRAMLDALLGTSSSSSRRRGRAPGPHPRRATGLNGGDASAADGAEGLSYGGRLARGPPQPSDLREGLQAWQMEVEASLREAAHLVSYALGADGRVVRLPAAGLRLLMGASAGATAVLRGLRNEHSTHADRQVREWESDMFK